LRANGSRRHHSLPIERRGDLRQLRPTAAQVDAARQQLALREVADHELHAAQPYGGILLQRLVEGSAVDLLGEVTLFACRQLERLGSRERESESLGQPLREGTPAEGQHLRAGDPAVPDERHIGGATSNVDEDGPRVAQLARVEAGRHGVRFGDHAQQPKP